MGYGRESIYDVEPRCLVPFDKSEAAIAASAANSPHPLSRRRCKTQRKSGFRPWCRAARTAQGRHWNYPEIEFVIPLNQTLVNLPEFYSISHRALVFFPKSGNFL